jgi:hypothetical protein
MDQEQKTKGETVQQYIELRRIADAMEEILRMVKADQERSRKYMEDKDESTS